MTPAGLRKRSLGSDRQVLGLFSLGIGLVLFLLIGMRALQAHRDGDQQLRNDSLWVLVSPLVFGGFGLRLITATPAPAGRKPRTDLEPARQAVQQAQALAERSRQAEQSKAQRELEAQLQQARAELEASRSASRSLEQQLRQSIQASEARAAELEQQRQQLGDALDQLRRMPAEAQPADLLAPVATALQTRAHALEARVAELDAAHRALQQQHLQALQQLQEQMQQELKEQIGERIAAFAGSWQAPLQDGERQIAALQGDWRQQWQALEAELAGARQDLEAAQEQRHRRSQQLEEQLSGLAGEVRQLAQGQQGLQQQLARSTGHAEQQQAQLQQQVSAATSTAERASTSLRQHLDQLQGEREGLCRTTAELEQWINRLERAHAVGDGAASGFEGSYEEACAELGVLPGSPWTAVRATWRQGLLRWHPDQGGDAGLWPRRHAAYQLLEAWYAFRQPPG